MAPPIVISGKARRCQCTIRPKLMKALLLPLRLFARVGKCQEPLLAQAFRSEPTAGGLDERIVRRLASWEKPNVTIQIRPVVQHPRDESRAVIHPDLGGRRVTQIRLAAPSHQRPRRPSGTGLPPLPNIAGFGHPPLTVHQKTEFFRPGAHGCRGPA
jgi:hypothetical protein